MDDLASRLAALAEKVSENDRLSTLAESAEWLGCGRRTLDQLIAERRIPAYLIGGRYRIDKHQVLKETSLVLVPEPYGRSSNSPGWNGSSASCSALKKSFFVLPRFRPSRVWQS